GMAGIDLALGLRVAQHRFNGATPSFKHRPQLFAHFRIFAGHFRREQPKHAAALKALIYQALRQELEMAFETFEWRDTLVEQHVRAGTFEITPQRVDREVFLVLEVIEERSLGDAGGLGNVLDRTSLEAEGMQRVYRAAGEFLPQAGS